MAESAGEDIVVGCTYLQDKLRAAPRLRTRSEDASRLIRKILGRRSMEARPPPSCHYIRSTGPVKKLEGSTCLDQNSRGLFDGAEVK